jgi:DNA-directed RNA polymerase specialized sigma subunit
MVYSYQGLTLREMGGALNVTESRVSQILRQARAEDAGLSERDKAILLSF